MKKPFLEAGIITSTHGIQGEVKLLPWADSPDFLQKIQTFYIDGQPHRILRSRVYKGRLLIAALEGITDVNAAMCLKNKVISISRADVTLPEGDFFIQDILGASVRTEDGAEVGVLEEVLDRPVQNIYVVRRTDGSELLIPAVEEFIRHTDVDAGVITVRLLEGM